VQGELFERPEHALRAGVLEMMDFDHGDLLARRAG
jgi:hypothetical protein